MVMRNSGLGWREAEEGRKTGWGGRVAFTSQSSGRTEWALAFLVCTLICSGVRPGWIS